MEGRAMTAPTPTSFESHRVVHHTYDYAAGTAILVSPFDGDLDVTRLSITAARTLLSDDPDIDKDYVDVTVKVTHYKINKSGKKSALTHTTYVNRTEQEANEWVNTLVRKARDEASQ